MNNSLPNVVSSERRRKELCEIIIIVDLDAHEYGTPQDDKPHPFVGIKMNALRPISEGEF